MSFLTLPSEIRLQIYDLVLCPTGPVVDDPAALIPLATVHSHEHPLLHVNRKIRTEALHIWLSRNSFLAQTWVPVPYAQAVRHPYRDVEKYIGNGYGKWLEELGPDCAKWTGKVTIKIVQYLAAEVIVEIPSRKVGDRDGWPKGKIKIKSAFDRPYERSLATTKLDEKAKLLETAVQELNRSRRTGRITIVCEDVPKFVDSIYEVITAAGKAEWEEYHPPPERSQL
ncbi:MAG: hypothetical protein M1821_009633 [Bathelium mastoideum]|nr:MAG: hypothetical protein M1821_009633 [Bathelium mastoideum]